MPSMLEKASRSRSVPLGQTTVTLYPASLSARLSCHTRRSNGTERFSTRIRALPSDTVVLSAAFEVGGFGQPNQVNYHLILALASAWATSVWRDATMQVSACSTTSLADSASRHFKWGRCSSM